MILRGLSRVGLGLVFLLAVGRVPAQAPRRLAVVEWAPDGRVLILAGGLLARFDLDSDEEELLDESGAAFALSPDGRRLAVGGRDGVELRSYPDFGRQAVLSLPGGEASESRGPTVVNALAWLPDGSTLVGGTRDGHLLLWEVEGGELWGDLGIEPPSPVARLAFSADGQRLLSSFEDGRAVLWDVEQRELLHRFVLPRNQQGVITADTKVMDLSPDGRRVLVNRVRAEESEMILLDDAGREVWRRGGYGVEFTPDGAALLALAPPFRIAVLYRTADAEALRIFEPPEGVALLYVVRLNPEGTKLLGVGEDYQGQVLVVWDFATARVLKTRR